MYTMDVSKPPEALLCLSCSGLKGGFAMNTPLTIAQQALASYYHTLRLLQEMAPPESLIAITGIPLLMSEIHHLQDFIRQYEPTENYPPPHLPPER